MHSNNGNSIVGEELNANTEPGSYQAILEQLKDIKDLVKLQKQMLTLDEFCLYTGMSKAYAYQLTSTGKVRFSRPVGKMIYFDIDDVVEFLRQNPVESNIEVKQTAINNFVKLKF